MRSVGEAVTVRRRVQPTRLRHLDNGRDMGPVLEETWELLWHGRWQRVQVLDSWRWAGRWWLGEAPRDYWLVELAGGATLEVYRSRDPAGWQWVVSRVQD